ncbi:MAG: hypothetical protein HFJ46_05005 [Clostridia bacterium]|nr:hypothetical protein [Clostridia bacterium]
MKIDIEKFSKFIKISAKIGLILLIFASVLILNHSVMLSPDDYTYSWVQGSNMERVDGIDDCIKTGKFLYNNWTGRIIPHVLVGIFRNMNPLIFEVINSLVFMLFIILITKVLNKKSGFLSILSVFGYLAFSMMFGEKFAWISGALNYLWPSTFMVILIYYFYNYYIGEKDLNILGKIALILFAFITGFSHENIVFVGGSFLLCVCLFKIKDFFKFDTKKKITIVLIFIMFCLGSAATIFAPGNFSRMGQIDTTFNWGSLGNYTNAKKHLIIVGVSMLVAFILSNINVIKEEKTKCILPKNWKKYDISIIKKEVLYFILPALIGTLPMLVISYFPPRAFLPYEAMFMIVLSANVQYIAEYFKKYEKTIAVVSVILTLIVFRKYSPSTLAEIRYIIPYKEKVTSQYEEAAKKGEKDVLVSNFKYSQWIHIEDWINIHNFFPEFNPGMPVNVFISMYYGFDRVTAIGDDEYVIEIKLNSDETNTYFVTEKETGIQIYMMQYNDVIRYTIPKDKLGSYLLTEDISNKVIDYSVRYIGGDLSKAEVALKDLMMIK